MTVNINYMTFKNYGQYLWITEFHIPLPRNIVNRQAHNHFYPLITLLLLGQTSRVLHFMVG